MKKNFRDCAFYCVGFIPKPAPVKFAEPAQAMVLSYPFLKLCRISSHQGTRLHIDSNY